MPTIRTETELLDLLADMKPITAAYLRDWLVSCRVDYMADVTSSIQDQLDAKEATITGAASTITSSNLTVSRALIANGSGKVAVSSVTDTELGYISGVTSAVQTQLNNKQGLDTTLTSLAAYNTNGLICQTAADTFTGRTITGTTDQVIVTNGNGVSGNPTLSLPQSIGTTSNVTFNALVLSILTPSRALVSGASGAIQVSTTSTTELGYLIGVSSGIQGQINNIISTKLDANGDEYLNLGAAITNAQNGSLIVGQSISNNSTERGTLIVGKTVQGASGTQPNPEDGAGGDGGLGEITIVEHGVVLGVAKGGIGGDGYVNEGSPASISWTFINGPSGDIAGGTYEIIISGTPYGPWAWNVAPSAVPGWTFVGTPDAGTITGETDVNGPAVQPTLDDGDLQSDDGSMLVDWDGTVDPDFVDGVDDEPADGPVGSDALISVLEGYAFAGGHAEGGDYDPGYDANIYGRKPGSFAFGYCKGLNPYGATIQASSGCLALGYIESGGQITAGYTDTTDYGSFAMGYVADGNSIYSNGKGSLAFGFLHSGGTSSIRTIADGAVAMGTATNGGVIQGAANGAFALGCASGSGRIEASQTGAFAIGYAPNGDIVSQGQGSFAGGTGNSSPDILSSNYGSFAFGFADGWGLISSGYGSVAIGWAANAALVASGYGSFVMGSGGTADLPCELQQGWDDRAARRHLMMNAQTSTATPTVMTTVTGGRITLPTDSTWGFTVRITARRTDANGESAFYKLEGCIDMESGGAGTTALVGSVTKTVIAEDTSAWDVNATADNTYGALVLTVTGENSKTIRWFAAIDIVQVKG